MELKIAPFVLKGIHQSWRKLLLTCEESTKAITVPCMTLAKYTMLYGESRIRY